MSAVALPEAEIAHVCAGRVRLRIAERRGDSAYFASVAGALNACDVIVAAQANPATASVVIQHRGELADVAHYAAREGLFTVARGMPVGESALRNASAGLRSINSTVQGLTHGVLDAPGLVYVGLVGLALVQALRGHVAGPATTLLWNALTLVQLGDLAKQVTRVASWPGPR